MIVRGLSEFAVPGVDDGEWEEVGGIQPLEGPPLLGSFFWDVCEAVCTAINFCEY